jgi:arylsulfatase A-like enzyme
MIALKHLFVQASLAALTTGGFVMTLAHTAEIACFRMDVSLLFIVIPLVLAVFLFFLPKSWQLPVLATICALLQLLIYAEARSFVLVGQLVSPSLLMSAISWGMSDSGARDYISVSSLVKLVNALALIIAFALLASRLDRRDAARGSWFGKGFLICYLALTLSISIACWAFRAPETPMTTSFVSMLMKASFGGDDATDRTKGLQSASLEELVGKYRQLAKAPISERDPAYWGRAKSANVIYIVLETGPARYLNMTGDLSNYPNLARLREHSLVGDSHHTTYPYTNRALLSLFSSLYPDGKKGFQGSPHRSLPGVISTLKNAGYETGVYGTLWTAEHDGNMFKSLGFDTLGVPSGGTYETAPQIQWQKKLNLDQEALHMLETDIKRWSSGNRKFVVAFLPQIGHGPWPNMSDDGQAHTVAERGLQLMRQYDSWAGEILKSLENDHVESNTIIVLTADHGLRNNVDDPDYPTGMVDEVSFHVPLFVYYPAAIPNRVDIPWITSHIDIGPTVLDLLGIESGRTLEEGAPIWQADLRGRTTFFLASGYFGTDGYYRDQKYYMVKYLSDSVYENSSLHFSGPQLRGTAADEVKERTNEMNALQSAMFLKFLLGTEK